MYFLRLIIIMYNQGADKNMRSAPRECARYIKETKHKLKFISSSLDTYKEEEAHAQIPEHSLSYEIQ